MPHAWPSYSAAPSIQSKASGADAWSGARECVWIRLRQLRVLRNAIGLVPAPRLSPRRLPVASCGRRAAMAFRPAPGVQDPHRFTWNPDLKTTARQVGRVGRRHDRSFRARFPALQEVGMAYRWGGYQCLSRNSVPAFGEVETGGFAAGAMHCRNPGWTRPHRRDCRRSPWRRSERVPTWVSASNAQGAICKWSARVHRIGRTPRIRPRPGPGGVVPSAGYVSE